jgi:hypothetical protein
MKGKEKMKRDDEFKNRNSKSKIKTQFSTHFKKELFTVTLIIHQMKISLYCNRSSNIDHRNRQLFQRGHRPSCQL